jgi:hypothetical protein
MKPAAYGSLAAFLAHWRALERAPADALDAQEQARRAEMEEIIAALRPEERTALKAVNSEGGCAKAGAARRHHERAELDLSRALRARGLLAA